MKDTTKAGSLVAITFNHDGTMGFVVKGVGALAFDPRKASLENRHCAQLLGWKNRIGDGAAVKADTDTGKVDPQAKYNRVKALIEFYENGENTQWAMKAAGGGAAKDDAGLIIMALMRVTGKSNENVERLIARRMTKLEQNREEVLRALGKAPDTVQAVGQIRAERAAAQSKVSAADLLDEMDDDEAP